jgi:hypothetical protein
MKTLLMLLPNGQELGLLFLYSFFLLALGDTGHVGFRVIAYLLGGVNGLVDYPTLVGIGSLSTAYTVTIFYMLVLEIWRVIAKQERSFLYWGLLFVGLVRLVIMIPSGNAWGTTPTPFDWSLARNIPLMIQGLVVAVLLLIHGLNSQGMYQSLFLFHISSICQLFSL